MAVAEDGTTNETISATRRRFALGLLCLAPFVAVYDTVAVAIALPAMGRDLDLSAAGAQWVLNGYALALGGLLLLGGRLADALGRRRVFASGFGLFALASLGAGLAGAAWLLVAARVVQGAGAAALEPAALALVTTLYPEPSRRNKAVGVYGAMVGLGYLVGIVLGGLLTELLGWRWVLFVNVPVAFAALLLAPTLLPGGRNSAAPRTLDLEGAATAALGLAALLFALSSSPSRGWASGSTLGLVVLGACALGAFVAIERRAAAPLLPLAVFRVRRVAVADATTLLKSCVGMAQLYVLTLYFQGVLGHGPLRAGLLFVPMALISIAAGGAGGRLTTRLGIRSTAALGLAILAGGLSLMVLLPTDGGLVVVLAGAVVGEVGFMLASVPLTIAATAGLPEDRRGLAAGLLGTSTQLGNSLGLAVVAAIVAAATGSPDGGTAEPAALAAGLRLGLLAGLAFVVAALLLVLVALPRAAATNEGTGRAKLPPGQRRRRVAPLPRRPGTVEHAQGRAALPPDRHRLPRLRRHRLADRSVRRRLAVDQGDL